MLVAILSAACDGAYFAYWLTGVVHAVLPTWMEAAGAAAAVYYGSRLRRPADEDALAVFGPESAPRCIAHRGAALDAPENTLAAFKFCAEQSCDFVEFDVRSCANGQLVLMHDADTRRLTGAASLDVATTGWDTLSTLDIAGTHPNRHQFQSVRICKLDEALDFLVERNMRMVIDVKGEDKAVISGVVSAFAQRPGLHARAAVTTFNPLVLYQIRARDPRIVGALSYRPYCFSHAAYDATAGPAQPRFTGLLQAGSRVADALHSALWRATAHWCRVSAVLLHKDLVSPCEVAYWRGHGVRTVGWTVNRPLEKLYWRGVLAAPYLANTLLGEPPRESETVAGGSPSPDAEEVRLRAGRGAVDALLSRSKRD